LGYEFWLFHNAKNRVELKYGITPEKRAKYRARLEELIASHISGSVFIGLELLRHKVAAFTSRTTYRDKKFRRDVWKVKGFISHYGELRYLLGTDLMDDDTQIFLKNLVEDTSDNTGIELPYFLV
jgi:hypothetical protein